MLRETDFVEGDWSALLWVLGSAAGLCRYSVSLELRALKKKCMPLSARQVARGALPPLAGIAVSALFLTICLAALSYLLASGLEPGQQRLADRLLWVAVPETVYVAGVLALWRRRKGFALGIMGAGVLLLAHAITHVVTHA